MKKEGEGKGQQSNKVKNVKEGTKRKRRKERKESKEKEEPRREVNDESKEKVQKGQEPDVKDKPERDKTKKKVKKMGKKGKDQDHETTNFQVWRRLKRRKIGYKSEDRKIGTWQLQEADDCYTLFSCFAWGHAK